MTYRSKITIRFGQCDPAGIVFYPRYLEMFSNLVEDWCREVDAPFFEIVNGKGRGLPTVHVDVDFRAPSLLGDTLSAALSVISIGGSSLTVQIALSGEDGTERVRGKVVLVLMDVQLKRPITIPDDIRGRLATFMNAPEAEPAGPGASAG